MKNSTIILLALCTLAACTNNKKNAQTEEKAENPAAVQKTTLTLTGETNDLPAAESIAFDEKRNVLYVSCQAGKEPGDGSIAQVSLEGKLLNPKFVSGLNDPKGIVIVNDKLYAGDLTELIEIDLESGSILKKYTDDKVEFLNDVTADEEGNVYVSDMFTSSIYRLDPEGDYTEWFSSPDLENPNGLLVVGDEIYIAGWGNFTDGKPQQAPPGRFLKINMQTKEITKITPGVLGNLDGVQVHNNNSFFVSDWKAGKVFEVDKNGKAEEILDTDQGSGDILFIPEKDLLIVPLKNQNKIEFYKTT